MIFNKQILLFSLAKLQILRSIDNFYIIEKNASPTINCYLIQRIDQIIHQIIQEKNSKINCIKIGALTSRILDKGLMDNKFLKNFFLSRDEQKKSKPDQRVIIEKKLLQCLRFPNKYQNQATIRLVEEFAQENGFTIQDSIKYQQYEILGKPIIFQPIVHVTKEENWFDIFEKFKSENLKITPNQNLQEFNNLIKNQQKSTWEKLSLILKQRFMIHDANDFPAVNPIIGNEDQDGNLQFLIDENLIPHRIIFRNKDEYDLMNWYVDNRNKNELNVITQDWNKYIKNVQQLREKQPERQERKIIQINNQMQVEQEQSSKLNQKSQQQHQLQKTNNEQSSLNFVEFQQKNISFRQGNTNNSSKVKIKSNENSQLQQQIRESETVDQLINNDKYVQSNQLTVDELAQQVLSNMDLFQNNEQATPQQYNDRVLITVQFPAEIKKNQAIKFLQTDKDSELAKGVIYLNGQELQKLDQEIADTLQKISFSIKKIKINGQDYSLSSPFCVITNNIPLNYARQWQFFKDKQAVQVYIIHTQIVWLFQQYLLDINMRSQAQTYIQKVQQSYIDKWLKFINQEKNIWTRTTNESLILLVQTHSDQLIQNSDDKNADNYVIKLIEDIWFVFSGIKQYVLFHTTYEVKQTILTYIQIKDELFLPNLNTETLLKGMKQFDLCIQDSPIFEPNVSHDVICWLCFSSHSSWEQFYIHKCNTSQAKQSFHQDHLQTWKLSNSK
ncbi:unnamed protein product [Paramecium sonneborni]|uniref:Uncharacterized protein n=2 Tax=Paramecium sonneborni TaxID=65129 RepID=A0A8S1RC05_9CILI|nr:unnamed protein product [Paramecium sonneborni]